MQKLELLEASRCLLALLLKCPRKSLSTVFLVLDSIQQILS